MNYAKTIEYDIAVAGGGVAGVAVSQALDGGNAITDIDVALLQVRLAKENVMIHFDDALIPADVSAVEVADIGHI